MGIEGKCFWVRSLMYAIGIDCATACPRTVKPLTCEKINEGENELISGEDLKALIQGKNVEGCSEDVDVGDAAKFRQFIRVNSNHKKMRGKRGRWVFVEE